MTKERLVQIKKEVAESRWPEMSIHLAELTPLLDLAEKRLDHLEANRKRVAKRRRKLKRGKA